MGDAPPRQRPQQSGYFPWYDSNWLSTFEHAKSLIRVSRPGFVDAFSDAFAPLRTAPDFREMLLEQVFDQGTLAEIQRVSAQLAPSQLEFHEARMFKRFIVHNEPFFCELQRRVVDRVSQAAGEQVEVSYNFLSLYGPKGICPLHLDAPDAKWTLDLCVRQSAPWPIHFSRSLPWPQREAGWLGQGWETRIKEDESLAFRSVSLQPGDAVLFSGPAQWHYRNELPAADGNGFCDLLFFHFIPRGTSELLDPANWARLFGVPELASLAI